MAAPQISVTVAARKIEGQWECAVISDGKFMRALTGKDLHKMIMGQFTALLAINRPEDTEVSVNINIVQGIEKPPTEESSGEKHEG